MPLDRLDITPTVVRMVIPPFHEFFSDPLGPPFLCLGRCAQQPVRIRLTVPECGIEHVFDFSWIHDPTRDTDVSISRLGEVNQPAFFAKPAKCPIGCRRL